MKRILLLFLLFVAMPVLAAQTWVEYSKGIYYDKNSVRILNDNKIEVWMKETFKQGEKEVPNADFIKDSVEYPIYQKVAVNELWLMYRFNCSEKTIKVAKSEFYDFHNKPVNTIDITTDYEPVEAGSKEEAKLNFFCK